MPLDCQTRAAGGTDVPDLVRDTLDDSFTDDNFGFAYLHDLGLFGRLEFAASYAGSPYFLGNWSRPDRDLYGDQVEVEAVWSMDF
jgi:hypothetical protein